MSKDRREFLRDTALVVLGGAASGLCLSSQVLAEEKTIRMNPQAKAVMPDGKIRTRAELMRELGLDPSTPPDAWLNIVVCGSNSSALTQSQREQLKQRGLKLEAAPEKMKRMPQRMRTK